MKQTPTIQPAEITSFLQAFLDNVERLAATGALPLMATQIAVQVRDADDMPFFIEVSVSIKLDGSRMDGLRATEERDNRLIEKMSAVVENRS